MYILCISDNILPRNHKSNLLRKSEHTSTTCATCRASPMSPTFHEGGSQEIRIKWGKDILWTWRIGLSFVGFRAFCVFFSGEGGGITYWRKKEPMQDCLEPFGKEQFHGDLLIDVPQLSNHFHLFPPTPLILPPIKKQQKRMMFFQIGLLWPQGHGVARHELDQRSRGRRLPEVMMPLHPLHPFVFQRLGKCLVCLVNPLIY